MNDIHTNDIIIFTNGYYKGTNGIIFDITPSCYQILISNGMDQTFVIVPLHLEVIARAHPTTLPYF